MQRVGLALLLTMMMSAASAADFTLENEDAGSGTGLDDATPTMPVGGNDGTTLGEQRRIALRRAARIVFGRVASTVPIRVTASVRDDGSAGLTCDRNSGTLGFGGPTNYTRDFSGAPRDDVLYPLPLANALAGNRIADDLDDVDVRLNGSLDAGRDDCLRGTTWYYGLDGDEGPQQLDFLATAVHEFIHGLGFQSLVAVADRPDARAGQFPLFSDDRRYPDIYSAFVQDLSFVGQPLWTDLTVAQRADSLDNAPDVVWSSSTTNSAAAGYLTAGLNQGRVELYAPSPVEDGSSISHWSLDLAPGQIMVPFESPDTGVVSGIGLSSCVLQDLGWRLAGGTRCPDVDSDAIVGDPSGDFLSTGTAQTSSDDGSTDDDSGGGGGGCTLAPGSRFDPLWALMLALALGTLAWRRHVRPAA